VVERRRPAPGLLLRRIDAPHLQISHRVHERAQQAAPPSCTCTNFRCDHRLSGQCDESGLPSRWEIHRVLVQSGSNAETGCGHGRNSADDLSRRESFRNELERR